MKHIPFESLSEYSDGRLSGLQRREIEEHLKACGDCREVLLLINNTNMAVKSLDRAELPYSFDRNFEAELSDRVRAKKEQRFGYRSPVLAAATAFLAAAVFLYGVLNYYPVESPEIALVKGNVTVFDGRQNKWITGKNGYVMSRGDIVYAAEGSFVDIKQAGKYTIRLKPNSRMRLAKALPKYIKGSVIYKIEKGKAFIAIEKKFRPSRFLIKTPEAAATALGTMFVVDVGSQPRMVSKFSVLEGNVRVDADFRQVTVGGGEATEVVEGKAPSAPRELLDKEWAELAEFYQIGQRVQVALLVSDGPNRVRELLRPCPIYISDVEPKTIGKSLEDTIRLIDEAIKTKDTTKHLEGIKKLEDVLIKYPGASYEPQLLLFIGAYYNYLNKYEDAILTFQKAAEKYPKSTFASMALYATGIVYENGLKDTAKAKYYYDLVLRAYPKSPEAKSIKRLGKK